jgi:hypothetical protein
MKSEWELPKMGWVGYDGLMSISTIFKFFSGTLVSSTNTINRHNITEVLLNTTNLSPLLRLYSYAK